MTKPEEFLEWVKTKTPTLRQALAHAKMKETYGKDYFVVTTQNHIWVNFLALGTVTQMMEFIDHRIRLERDGLDLYFEFYLALHTPNPKRLMLPVEGSLDIPITAIPTVPVVLGLRQLH